MLLPLEGVRVGGWWGGRGEGGFWGGGGESGGWGGCWAVRGGGRKAGEESEESGRE